MKKTFGSKYDVAIIGGGITGAALLYVLANYTDISRIVLFEKYSDVAQVNSHYNNNSQTLHFGDIETNYTLEKAGRVKEAAEMLLRYMERFAKDAFVKGHKMALAVGEKETTELGRRFEEFRILFPKLKKIGRDELALIEPKVMEGRDSNEKVAALYTEDGYAVDFQKLSQSFVREAGKSDKDIKILFNTEVKEIRKGKYGYVLITSDGSLETQVVAVMAGPHSLVFAKKMGYGKNLGILPVAGSFYYANNILAGKVYTMQIKKLPFAAVHGDPNVNNLKETRFGPTAKVLPLLERHNYRTVLDFLKTSVWSFAGVFSLVKIISDPILFWYVIKNIGYDLPIVGRWLFLQDARKIVPSLQYKDLHFGKGLGGIRPQVVNAITKKLEMGEAEIVGDNILFNITPSPGASVSLKNAEQDALKIIGFFKSKFHFDQKRWCDDFGSTMAVCKE